MTAAIEARIDPGDFARLMKDIRAFDQQLATATRKRLRDAAALGVNDVRQRLRTRPFKKDVGLAKGLAEGTKVSILTGKRTAGVEIRTTGTKLPASKQAMVRAYDQATFRHPVFAHPQGERDVRGWRARARLRSGVSDPAHSWRWVTQHGRPYFGSVLDQHKADMRVAMEQALRDAAATIRAGEAS